jgi:hypothetical protein
MKYTELIITGRVEDRNLLKKIDGVSNITYQGFLDRDEVLNLETSSDVMIALYDLNLQTQKKCVISFSLFEVPLTTFPILQFGLGALCSFITNWYSDSIFFL